MIIELIAAGIITAFTYYCNYKFEQNENRGKTK